jgi:hypothetical protein
MGVQGAQSSTWDQVFEEIAAGRAFTRGHVITSNAGTVGEIQLLNPAGSGVNVQVIEVSAGSVVAQQLGVMRSSNVAPTLFGLGHNLLTGLYDSACELRFDVGGAGGAALVLQSFAPANVMQRLWSRWGPQLSPGEGYSFISTVNASTFCAIFHWVETPA